VGQLILDHFRVKEAFDEADYWMEPGSGC
jgi:hypothetical protein